MKSPQPVGWLNLLRRPDSLSVLLNYVRLWRSGLFDRNWYRRQYPDVDGRRVDTLLHYLLRGGMEGRKPNPVFDSGWYRDVYADVAEAGINPLLHYLLYGRDEGRDPSGSFSVKEYLAQNPDVAASRMHPLKHYLRFGREEGRHTGYHEEPVGRKYAARPKAPDHAAWNALAASARPAPEEIKVDVIVPVYAGKDDTLACIYSVLRAANATPYELIVINDASPEPELSEALDEIARLGLVTLLKNEGNLGFVGTANRGMRMHPRRDVVLLNSDTVVHGNWLDRIVAHGAEDRVGTVTPLSTNATICSYPSINRNNAEELEVGFEELDRICAEVNRGRRVELPTGVGFCMFLRRTMLDQIGYFDEESFSRGYGEENDLCRRAASSGWSNVLAADVFVRHTGEVSFASSAKEAQRTGMKALLRKHPDYNAAIKGFAAEDPIAPLRRRIDAGRLGWRHPRNVLFVSHTWGGGIERHMKDMAGILDESGVGVIFMRPRLRDSLWAAVGSSNPISVPNLKNLHVKDDVSELVELLSLANVHHIHVHSLAGWAPEMLRALPDLAAGLNVPLDFTFHDFMPICPRINMVEATGVFCGGPEATKCRACLKKGGESLRRIDVDDWRRDYTEFLAHTRLRFAPSNDTAKWVRPYIGDMPIEVRSHPENGPARSVTAVPFYDGEVLRVAVIGAIGLHKGSNVLYRAARDAKRRKLPIEYVVVGYTDRDAEFEKLGNVQITGVYSHDRLDEILARERCHVAMIPSVWPETYSYTLSEALAAGFSVAVFPFGAPYDRLREFASKRMIVLPMTALDKPDQINSVLLKSAETLEPPAALRKNAGVWTYSSYYRTA